MFFRQNIPPTGLCQPPRRGVGHTWVLERTGFLHAVPKIGMEHAPHLEGQQQLLHDWVKDANSCSIGWDGFEVSSGNWMLDPLPKNYCTGLQKADLGHSETLASFAQPLLLWRNPGAGLRV